MTAQAPPGYNNPSRSVVADLANNPVLPGIKAVFFLQTEAARSGGSARGARPWNVNSPLAMSWPFTPPRRFTPIIAG